MEAARPRRTGLVRRIAQSGSFGKPESRRSPSEVLARVPVREFLRYRGMALFGRPAQQRVYSPAALPQEKSPVVPGGVSSREDTDIIEGRRSFVSKTLSATVICSAVCMALLSTA